MKVIVIGSCGRLGSAIVKKLNEKGHFTFGVDLNNRTSDNNFSEILHKGNLTQYQSTTLPQSKDVFDADIIIDVSSHKNSKTLLEFALKWQIPVVIGCTGHNEQELKAIKQASTRIPIFLSYNFSIGLQYFYRAVEQLCLAGTESINLIETHHKNKFDAPSGTAKEIERVINNCGQNVNIFSIRGGDVIGIHELNFLLNGERITLTHTADTRDTFAHGALSATEFLLTRPAGLYSMSDLINIF